MIITQRRQLPFGPEELLPFTEELFDCEEEKAARILFSILESRSPRKSDWSQVFSESSEEANYRTIDRALPKLGARKALMRLYDPESPFVVVDPTEMMVGESARDEAYSEEEPEEKGGSGGMRRKWRLYSGLFVLLKKRLLLPAKQWRSILTGVLASWRRRLFPPLPGSVQSHD